MVFSESRLKEIEEIKHRYPEGRHKSALLPVLHLAQEDHGWLPVDVMDEVAKVLDLHPIEVYEVATFYTMFHVKPVGKYVLEVCRTGPCCNVGAEELIIYLEENWEFIQGRQLQMGCLPSSRWNVWLLVVPVRCFKLVLSIITMNTLRKRKLINSLMI